MNPTRFLLMSAKLTIENLTSSNPVVIFSKTYCPYCVKVKKLFASLSVNPVVMELDNEPEVQKELGPITGGTSVPRVFVDNKFIGGCDDTHALHQQGKLVPLLVAAGVLKQ